MNLLIPGALIGALLMPVAPIPPEAGSDRISVAHGWPEPDRPRAVWPLAPRPEVVAGFERPSTAWSAGHRGVDLAGAAGAAVRAALPGTIVFAGRIAGRGVVVVDHGTFRTTYEPVRSSRRRGDSVEAGAEIGRLERGRSHCAPRSCLHWGLVTGSEYSDPLGLLGRRQVRLLPFADQPQARGWARW